MIFRRCVFYNNHIRKVCAFENTKRRKSQSTTTKIKILLPHRKIKVFHNTIRQDFYTDVNRACAFFCTPLNHSHTLHQKSRFLGGGPKNANIVYIILHFGGQLKPNLKTKDKNFWQTIQRFKFRQKQHPKFYTKKKAFSGVSHKMRI
jgi:hypothetical protein